MSVHRKAQVKWAWPLLYLFTLTLFFVACGGSGNTTATPTPTPTPSGTPYNGNGYTLTYPQGWTSKQPVPISVVFTSNSDPNTTFTISVTPVTPLTKGDVSTELKAAQELFSHNGQPDPTVPSTASVGGDSWQQVGATATKSGQNTKGVILADQHPTGTGNIFVITLTAPTASYDQTYSSTFKPMLDSFKFS